VVGKGKGMRKGLKGKTGKRGKGEKREGPMEKKRIESFEDLLVWQKGIV